MPIPMGTAMVVGLRLLTSTWVANLDVESGATLEGRQGSTPANLNGSGGAGRDASVAAFTPGAGMSLSDRETLLKLRYFPTLTWISVGGQPVNRTYVLHNADLVVGLRAERRVAFTLRATLTTGDTDYAAITRVLGRLQGEIPNVTGFTSGVAAANVTMAVTRRSRIEVTLEALHRSTLGPRPPPLAAYPDCPPPPPLVEPRLPPPAPVDATPTAATLPPPPPVPEAAGRHPPSTAEAPSRGLDFPTQNSLALVPAMNHEVTRHDSVGLRAALGSIWLSNGLQMLSAGPHVGWTHSFEHDEIIRFGAGLVHTELVHPPAFHRGCGADVARPATATLPRSTLNPVADLAIGGGLFRSRGFVLSASFGGGAVWYFDPVASRAGALGTVSLDVVASMPPDWSARAETFFSTSLRARPQTGEPDETVFGLVLPVRHRVSRDMSVELGGRWSDRGPHLQAQDFHFRRRELWIYAAATCTLGTARNAQPTVPAAL